MLLPEFDMEMTKTRTTLERVPDEGDTVESERYDFRVTRMDGPRIVEVQATPKPGGGGESADKGNGLNPIATGEEDGIL